MIVFRSHNIAAHWHSFKACFDQLGRNSCDYYSMTRGTMLELTKPREPIEAGVLRANSEWAHSPFHSPILRSISGQCPASRLCDDYELSQGPRNHLKSKVSSITLALLGCVILIRVLGEDTMRGCWQHKQTRKCRGNAHILSKIFMFSLTLNAIFLSFCVQ